MCGIAGWFSAAHHEQAEAIVREIADSQFHRGPDFTAVEPVELTEGFCVLGHNRLSIIDLSAEANQPIYDESGQVGLVFNGEVYNYVEVREELKGLGRTFRTQSDTEVLLQAYLQWGTDAMSRLNGMFAFGLVDRRKNLLWLVRDRFGVKPLYVYREGSSVWFASTGRVLAQRHGLGPNWNYLYKGVSAWNFDDDSKDSQYEGLEMMPPGGMLVCQVEGGRLKVEESCWYDLESRTERLRDELCEVSDGDLVARVLETFESACQIRLRADVPVAVALSGGLDSAAVTCMVGNGLGHHEVKGFSFGDPTDDKTEGPVAARLAKEAGIDVQFIPPSHSAVRDAFDRTLEAQDAPFVSVSQVAQYLVAKATREGGYKVLLGGQGGDEAFMGYRKYFVFVLKELAAQKRVGELLSLVTGLVPVFLAERSQAGNYWRHRKRFQSVDDQEQTVLAFPEGVQKPEISFHAGQPSWRRQMLDVMKFSLPTLLRYEDRNSMAHSIETRLPFLDYRMIELGLALPERLKVRHGFGKWAVREAVKGLVPDEVRVARYKVGFAVDQGTLLDEGLGNTLRGWVKDDMDGARRLTRSGFDPDRDFSNERLVGSVNAMPELMSLAWMLRRF